MLSHKFAAVAAILLVGVTVVLTLAVQTVIEGTTTPVVVVQETPSSPAPQPEPEPVPTPAQQPAPPAKPEPEPEPAPEPQPAPAQPEPEPATAQAAQPSPQEQSDPGEPSEEQAENARLESIINWLETHQEEADTCAEIQQVAQNMLTALLQSPQPYKVTDVQELDSTMALHDLCWERADDLWDSMLRFHPELLDDPEFESVLESHETLAEIRQETDAIWVQLRASFVRDGLLPE